MTTLVSASLSGKPRRIEPTWLAYSLLVSVWVYTSVTCIVIAMLTGGLEPKIQLSHRRGRVTFGLQGLKTHVHESLRH